VRLGTPPSPTELAWLTALRHAGVAVAWTNAGIAPLAIEADPLADPAGGIAVAVAAPGGSRIAFRDSLGVLDTMVAANGGARTLIPAASEWIGASVGTTMARITVPAPLSLKRLLVEGSAGWETKFAIAALQERGWRVDALTHVAPGVDVREGSPQTQDTARYAAVVIVDTSAVMATRGLAVYVREGGGLVTLHDAATVGPPGEHSVTLEQGANGAVTAARAGAGRIVRVSYANLWRRRMRNDPGVADPVATERAWLAQVLAAAARAEPAPQSEGPLAGSFAAGAAPLVQVVAQLGQPEPLTPARALSRSAAARIVPDWLLFAAALAALGAEWLSRRLRGDR